MASLLRQSASRQGFAFSGSGSSVLKTDEVAKWFDEIWTESAFGGSSKHSPFSLTFHRFGLPRSTSMSACLRSVLFPPLPPWLATLCSLCRVIAFIIIAPIFFVSLLDLAEYAVIRTLGLRRRKVRVKAPGATTHRKHLSPAQLWSGQAGHPNQAPLLSTGAYDAETLLRHRARSLSTASAEAIDEWQRTGGSFARVAEVRQAASSTSSTPGGDLTTSRQLHASYFEPTATSSSTMTRSAVGVEGALGLSESEAEGEDESESGSSSPITEVGGGQQPRRRKLRRSEFDFTPLEEKKKFQWSETSSISIDEEGEDRISH